MKLSPGIYHCLSIWQPWAWAIFHGKPIENRTWPSPHRGRLLIHASKTTEDVARVTRLIATDFKIVVPEQDRLVFGAILGMVDLWDCKWSRFKSPCGWGVPEAYHWHLRNAVLLDEPIPWRGQQGVFHVRITESMPGEKLLL